MLCGPLAWDDVVVTIIRDLATGIFYSSAIVFTAEPTQAVSVAKELKKNSRILKRLYGFEVRLPRKVYTIPKEVKANPM